VRCCRPPEGDRLVGAISLLLLLMISASGWSGTTSSHPPGARPGVGTAAVVTDTSRSSPADPDTLTFLPPVIVTASQPRTVDPEVVSLDLQGMASCSIWSVDELGPLLPSTMVGLNSRGESQFMLRGTPERHARVTIEGLPLAVPWDERADLSILPMSAVQRVQVHQAGQSVLLPPGTLAGQIDLRLVTLDRAGRRAQLELDAAEGGLRAGRLRYDQRAGQWHVLAAAARRTRDSFAAPAGYEPAFHHERGTPRLNSDLEQISLLASVDRSLRDSGQLRLLLLGFDGSKGVPPETHLDEDARFWRYPLQRRVLAGLLLDLSLDRRQRWELATRLSLDRFRQEIRPYAGDAYAAEPLLAGDGYETNRDRTSTLEVRLRRQLGGQSSLTLQSGARATRHEETLVVGGPRTAYEQTIVSTVAELELRSRTGWVLRAGGGHERAATPETGDKPARDPASADVLGLYLARRLAGPGQLYASFSRRSRFPSLREMFSGALGRFLPNPDLRPERCDRVELGGAWQAHRVDLSLAGFGSDVSGPIEKTVVPEQEELFQRANVDDIRILGLEAMIALRPRPGLDFLLHHTFLRARRKEVGGFTEPVEDRPDYLGGGAVSWQALAGPRLRLEWELIGPRHGADPTAASGLSRLPAGSLWNLHLGWRWQRADSRLSVEASCGVLNLFDSQVDAQPGLTRPGRTLMVGLDLQHGVF
jgi:iron complex outermembrane receptor protein